MVRNGKIFGIPVPGEVDLDHIQAGSICKNTIPVKGMTVDLPAGLCFHPVFRDGREKWIADPEKREVWRMIRRLPVGWAIRCYGYIGGGSGDYEIRMKRGKKAIHVVGGRYTDRIITSSTAVRDVIGAPTHITFLGPVPIA